MSKVSGQPNTLFGKKVQMQAADGKWQLHNIAVTCSTILMARLDPDPSTCAWSGHGPADLLNTLVVIQAMLLMDDTGSLLRFVQRPNSVDLAEGCHILRSAGRYSELVALLQQHSQYDQALDLLRNLSQDPSRLEVPPRGRSCMLC